MAQCRPQGPAPRFSSPWGLQVGVQETQGSAPLSWCHSSVALTLGDSSAEHQVREFLKPDSLVRNPVPSLADSLPQARYMAVLRLICKSGGNNAYCVSEVGFYDKQTMHPNRGSMWFSDGVVQHSLGQR